MKLWGCQVLGKSPDGEPVWRWVRQSRCRPPYACKTAIEADRMLGKPYFKSGCHVRIRRLKD